MDKRILIATILVLSLVGTASATTWSVDGSGGADFTVIQDAINNASDGDTIIVYSGVYYENVVVDKLVTLKGIGQPVVDAGGKGAIRLTADGITLEGFNVTNAGSSLRDAGIVVTSNDNIIAGNNVSNNNRGGIYLSSSSNNSITGNNVCNNNYDGIYLRYSSNNNTITGNVFVNDGLSVYSSYHNTVEDNTVNGKPLVYLEDVSDYKVEDSGQVIIVNCNNITIENLDLSNTYGGIALWKTENSKISNNTVCNNEEGIRLSSSSNNNTITGNNVCNNDYGIRLHSSRNNFITGNNVSSNNYDGVYLSSSSNNNTITSNNVCNNEKGIRLYSYSNNNTITGNNVRNNSGYGILIHESSNNSLTGNNVSYNNDNGICLEGSDNNTITGNNVCNNNKNGIVIYSSCNNTITGNTINSNKQSGITPWDSDNNIITGNNVSSNKYYGIYLSYSVNNIIRGNNFSSNNEGTDLSFSSDNNTITGNTFVNDGLFVSSSHQNTVEDNTVNDKPLVYLENASDYKVEDAGQVILANCTNITVENLDLSNTSIGVALLNTGNSIISNNTVRNNSRKGISLLDSSSNTITCNNVYNNKVGISISADDNRIYLNNFIDNTINDFWPGNIWNSPWEITYIYNGTTYTSNLGNYWDDYDEKYPDSEEIDTTGIWDTPHGINSGKDTYLLTMRFENYIILTQKECEVDVNNIRYDWYESLSWIKKNTPDPCVDYYVSFPGDKTDQESAYSVMSWCDYGNWITCIAHRIPVANSQIAATFFISSNESEANEVADSFDVRYVVSAFPMADAMSSYQNLFGEIAFCANDTTGYYTENQSEGVTTFELGEEYFKTMVTRLHMFDGTEAEFRGGYLGKTTILLFRPFHTKPLRHYRLVHESSTYMIPHVSLNVKTDDIQAWNCYVGKNYTKAERLADELRHGFTDHKGPNLVRWTPPFVSPMSRVKVFEYVKGARIKGHASNGSTVMIATNITTNQGREFMYSQMAISNGTYEFVVPYSTDGPIEGGTNFDVLAAHYVLRAGHIENETMVFDTMKEVEVAEEEVMEGKTVRVDLV